MVRPVNFGFNEQTAGSNPFQKKEKDMHSDEIQRKALIEFDAFVNLLKSNGIEVIVFEDTLSPHTPDSIFPNNWISFHPGNTIVIYPMLAENRRQERRNDIIDYFIKEDSTLLDFSNYENQNQFLEGTGSIVFDYENKIAYAGISPRTDEKLFESLCRQLKFQSFTFKNADEKGIVVYHTNVIMSVGKGFAVLCKDCFTDKEELNRVIQSLENTNHEIISIANDQMNSFAGNMYQLFNRKGESFIVMSEQAFLSLSKEQIKKLEKYGTILSTPLYTIEKYGGGSARCMLADMVD